MARTAWLLLLLWLAGAALAGGARPVAVAEVEARALGRTIERPGTLFHRRVARIYNREAGAIARLDRYPGDRVRKGELVVSLDSRLLRAEIRKAEATLDLKRRRLERLVKLQKQHAASTDELNEAATELEVAKAELARLRTRLGFYEIRAPFDGVVTERLVEPGDGVARFTHLLTIADPASLRARFELDGEALAELAVGDAVTIVLDGVRRPGRLTRLAPVVDPVSRLGSAEAAFETIPPAARAGRSVEIVLATRPRPRLLVPLEAVQTDRRGAWVWVVADGRAERRRVEVGRRFGAEVALRAGVEAGEKVVVRGFPEPGAPDRVAVRVTGEAESAPVH